MKNPIPRPEISNLPPVHHGSFDFAELERIGLRPEDVIDFSVNSNHYGPSPAVIQAITQVDLDCYPDREALALRRAISAHLDAPIEKILIGNGAAELLWLLALAYLRAGDRVLILAPTFGEYANVAALMGAEVETWFARSEQDFAFVPDEIATQLKEVNYRLVFLCNPNNPTGQALSVEVLANWAKNHPETLFVVDEAYLSFVEGMESCIGLGLSNVLILRSMTKDYALAGLRLGYTVGSVDVIQTLARVRPPWSVNALAQAAGVAALSDQVYLQASLRKIWDEKDALVRGLCELGLSPLPSLTHFFVMSVGDGAAFRRALLTKGLQVRDCASFGLPAYARIATRSTEENQRLLTAIEVIAQNSMEK